MQVYVLQQDYSMGANFQLGSYEQILATVEVAFTGVQCHGRV